MPVQDVLHQPYTKCSGPLGRCLKKDTLHQACTKEQAAIGPKLAYAIAGRESDAESVQQEAKVMQLVSSMLNLLVRLGKIVVCMRAGLNGREQES